MAKVFHDLSKRFLMYSGIVLLLGVCFWGIHYLPVQILMVLFIALITMMAMTEYGALVQHKGETLSKFILAFLGFFWTFAFFLYPSWVWLILFFLAFFVYNFFSIEGAIYRIATGSFAMLYILVPIGMFLTFLFPEGVGSIGNMFVALYLIVVTKMADMGGYFMGRFLGGAKLAPRISPSKTVVGAVFGLIFSIAVSCLFTSVMDLTLTEAIFLGALIGIASELGDLAESVLKRDAHVKDSNQIPGFGGVLDLVDSLLFTTPILFAYFRF
ncbi:MAG: phosphatidate cytidylyltransferase [Chlamydiia bacterium]